LDMSYGYLWSQSIDGVMSAACECVTDNIEMLSCEPKQELEMIQECDYFDSSVGGICPYTVDTRHVQWNEEGGDSAGSLRYLSSVETLMLNCLTGKSIRDAMHIPLSAIADEDTTKYLMYAPVKPHQGLRISQLLIHCGSYTMRTTELRFDYEMAEANKWVLNPAAGRLYYFSLETELETRENAASKCENLGGRLATLDRPEEADFAARVVTKNFNDNATSWWTAATTSEQDEKCWLRWERGGLVNNFHFGQCREEMPCVLVKLSWPSDPVDRYFLTECENQLPFACEKFPEL
ncbi:hypothetical protein AAVH_09674, partial [Aphelenchoides avenae]